MTRYTLLTLALAAGACSPAPSGAAAPATPATSASLPSTTTAIAGDSAVHHDAVSGVVAETMNSGGYTYARLTTGAAAVWIAGSEFPLQVGDTITAAVDLPMENFRSRTLDRTFPLIYFVRDVVLNGTPLATAAASAAATAPAMVGSHDASSPALIAPVAAAPGGVTVADAWAKRAALSGKPVVIRGQVVKVNYDIMGTNWYHLQDGTGVVADGTHDLVVTSAAQVKTGDVVTVTGVLVTGKDFGAGYSYDAMVEQADIRK